MQCASTGEGPSLQSQAIETMTFSAAQSWLVMVENPIRQGLWDKIAREPIRPMRDEPQLSSDRRRESVARGSRARTSRRPPAPEYALPPRFRSGRACPRWPAGRGN